MSRRKVSTTYIVGSINPVEMQVTDWAKPRNDNMPEKVTAHTVRELVGCENCGGIGDRRLMLEFNGGPAAPSKYHHTSCYALARPTTLHTLSPSNLAKLRLCDLSHLTDKQRDKVFAASKRDSRDGYGRYANARVRRQSSANRSE